MVEPSPVTTQKLAAVLRAERASRRGGRAGRGSFEIISPTAWRRSAAATAAPRSASSPLKAMSSAAATVSAGVFRPLDAVDQHIAQLERRLRRDPIGTCHGLNSAHSPRIVTSMTSGKRQVFVSDSMLMQLPTPLDCISSAPRWPPSQAPASSATPSSSVVSGTARISGSSWHSSISRACPASGT